MLQIKNKLGQKAFILDRGTDVKQIDAKKPFRVYFWIDNMPITEKETQKFQCLFEEFQLKNEMFNKGELFLIDEIECENSNNFNKNNITKKEAILSPRQGQDGGVLG